VAEELFPDEVSASAIRERVLALLGDGPVRATARRLQAEIHTMPPPDEVAAALRRRFA